MENIIKKYNNSNVYMVAGLDSLGVPYTIDNTQSKSFVDLVVQEFRVNGINIEYVNLCSLARNKTWELKEILEKDYTKGQYYKINRKHSKLVVDSAGNNIRFNHPVNPNFITNYYDNVQNPDIKITTELKQSQNPIFLYTCGGMNFDYYTKMPSCDVRQIAPELILHLNKNLKQTISDVEDCINFVTSLNEKMEVYVLGVYSMIEYSFLRFIAQPFYAIYNKKIKEICDKFPNVHYVDIFGTKRFVAYHDNHPTFEGQKYITKQIIKVMNDKK